MFYVSTFFTFNQFYSTLFVPLLCVSAFSHLDRFLNTSVCFESGVVQIRAVTESHMVLIGDYLTFFIHEYQDRVGELFYPIRCQILNIADCSIVRFN